MQHKSKIPTPTPEKLAAWLHVRNVWKAMKKNAYVSPELLDAEYEASLVD